MRAVCLLSGGIDSPVAAYVMSEAGADIVLLHMDNRPYSGSSSVARVEEIASRLREVTGKELPLYSAPHGPAQEMFMETCDRSYQCVLCKHAMQLTAKHFCGRIGAGAIVMGDSLGQVASQTLRNIASENLAVGFTVLRPLIGYDKLEIKAIAERIGTYDISTLPASGCTALPRKVVTGASPDKAAALFEKSGVERLAERAADAAVRLS
ncbi:tRNA 4-thiouridine(8) synthase ThiI [Methanomassiliicoccaceae archaeon COG_1]|nr:tRNA 4-thiouridine(8) synthase ThiI [Methanomassiliicoccaceae archaeon COG_1]